MLFDIPFQEEFYTFPEPRNPKEPQNLTLSDARLVGGKLRITLRWVKPASDVPITFYKVFWSRLVHGPTNDSILVYHRTVLKVSFVLGMLKIRFV